MKFLPLDDKSVALVAENEKLFRNYLDALMLLEDLVSPFSSHRSHRTFTLDYTRSRADEIMKEIKSENSAVYDNLCKNLETANRIVEEAGSISSVENAHVVETKVDEFVDTLLQVYGMLRNERKIFASAS